ncbi:hypothetical protein AVEN_212173-1 [Araneus ventricosus]|uniref:Uncharacterized protein n=1 Tax=Araneus ventricosus TaxID=182803 RepID=A0A4Y2RX48_ARAVE|nr:hypothetical protein AVEN_212173-1 [Araneus ventricosus]
MKDHKLKFRFLSMKIFPFVNSIVLHVENVVHQTSLNQDGVEVWRVVGHRDQVSYPLADFDNMRPQAQNCFEALLPNVVNSASAQHCNIHQIDFERPPSVSEYEAIASDACAKNHH